MSEYRNVARVCARRQILLQQAKLWIFSEVCLLGRITASEMQAVLFSMTYLLRELLATNEK